MLRRLIWFANGDRMSADDRTLCHRVAALYGIDVTERRGYYPRSSPDMPAATC